jgi:hypothetical protein
MKPHTPDIDEGAAAFERFRRAVKFVLSVAKNALPPRPHRKKKKAVKPEGAFFMSA